MNQPEYKSSIRRSAQASTSKGDELTKSQTMIWAGQQLAPNAPLYNMALRFDIHAAIDVPRFRKAFQQVVGRVDALRTIIIAANGKPFQRVLEEVSANVELIDLSHHVSAIDECKQMIDERCRRPFDLAKSTFDTALLKISEEHFVWFLNQHHIVTDAWSMSLIYHELEKLYRDLESTARSNEHAFADFREFESSGQNRPAFQQAKSHWEAEAEKPLSALELYGNQISESSSDTIRIPFALGNERTQRLLELAEQPGVKTLSLNMTLFNLFFTAYVAYLYKVSRQSSFAIGAPAHNRSSLKFRETIGLLMEVFPVHIELGENETFRTLLDKVAESGKNFLLNAIPGSSCVAGNRRVNAVLNYIHATFSDFDGHSMTPEWIHAGSGDPRHVIRLQIHDFGGEGQFLLYFDVNETVVPNSTKNSIPQHFAKLLDAMIDELDQPIEQISLITPEEFERIVTRFNSESVHRDPNVTVLELFDRCVTRHPDAIAIVDGTVELTYQQLQRQSRVLAAEIRKKLGNATDQRIGICLDRSADLVVAILGVLYSESAYVPIDPAFPTRRIQFLLDDTRAALVLSDSSWQERFESRPFKTVDRIAIFDDLQNDLDQGNDVDEISSIPASNLADSLSQKDAYVIYTSGSTGKPKGVVIDHCGLAEYVQWARDTYVKDEQLSFPLYSPFTFDLTVTSIFVPLVSGGKIVVYADEQGPADLSILRVFEENLVDVVKLTPSHLSLLSEESVSDSRVRILIVGGEDLTADLASRIHSAFSGRVAIYNEYGPTEAVVGCMIHRFDPNLDRARSVPIGRPATNRRIYIMDSNQNVVPEGVPGELCVGGAGIARGYLNLAHETADRFLADPFFPGQRMYRTGDLARRNQDGQIEFMGRIDSQIKINGVRIEPNEIENTLLLHPNVSNAVVDVVGKDVADNSRVVLKCQRCGIPSNYPDVEIDKHGICDICTSFDKYQHRVADYFRTMDDLKVLFDDSRTKHNSEFDCLVLLSGGKDSTYALCRLVEMGLRVLTATLDNGYISDGAKENIERIAKQLGVQHVYLRTPAMNAIFVDSLNRHSNVCHGCFKTIYTLAVQLAHERSIPIIVTGLSRGQLFETRLTKELFDSDQFDSDEIDRTVLEARKAYHRIDDAVAQELDVSLFQTDAIFDEIRFVDFYRYCDVQLDDMLGYLHEKVPWVRPEDTGRSTNCLINEAGIFVHLRKERYHNYALPYSWDVRMGHKKRDAALEELNDEIDPNKVTSILNEIGYRNEILHEGSSAQRISLYYTTSSPIGKDELKSWLAERLPSTLIPNQLISLEKIPLTANGKVDRQKLRDVDSDLSVRSVRFEAPIGGTEQLLASIWQRVLRERKIGRLDNFFDLGGDSIAAIQIIAQANRCGVELSATQLFKYQTIAELAKTITLSPSDKRTREDRPAGQISSPAGSKRSLPELSDDKLAQLSKALNKKKRPSEKKK